MLETLKSNSKRYGASLNEYFLAVLNVALHEYSGGKEPSPFYFMTAVSTRRPIDSFGEFTPLNKATVLKSKMDLYGELTESVEELKR